jgi:hypothetical protein
MKNNRKNRKRLTIILRNWCRKHKASRATIIGKPKIRKGVFIAQVSVVADVEPKYINIDIGVDDVSGLLRP